MNFPINQHIVPKFILQNFVDESGKLHCHHKPTDKAFCSTPEQALRERYFYTEVIEGGTPTNNAEKRLADLESDFRPLSVDLVEAAREGGEIRFSTEAINQVHEFVLVQFRRSRRVNTLAQQVSEDRGTTKNALADLIFDNPLNPKLDGAVQSTGFVLGVPEGSRKAFIIGDSPVVLLTSPDSKHAEISMPIASDVAIILSSTTDQPVKRQLGPWQVGIINKEIAKFSNTIASDCAAYTGIFRTADLDDDDWPGA